MANFGGRCTTEIQTFGGPHWNGIHSQISSRQYPTLLFGGGRIRRGMECSSGNSITEVQCKFEVDGSSQFQSFLALHVNVERKNSQQCRYLECRNERDHQQNRHSLAGSLLEILTCGKVYSYRPSGWIDSSVGPTHDMSTAYHQRRCMESAVQQLRKVSHLSHSIYLSLASSDLGFRNGDEHCDAATAVPRRGRVESIDGTSCNCGVDSQQRQLTAGDSYTPACRDLEGTSQVVESCDGGDIMG